MQGKDSGLKVGIIDVQSQGFGARYGTFLMSLRHSFAVATHHIGHRPVWAEHAEQTKTFLGSLGPTRKTEKARLQGDHDRALRVLAAIDAAADSNRED